VIKGIKNAGFLMPGMASKKKKQCQTYGISIFRLMTAQCHFWHSNSEALPGVKKLSNLALVIIQLGLIILHISAS